MLTQIIIIALITTAVHVSTWDGMLLHRPALLLGDLLDRLHLTVLRKPLFECLICMGGIYTLLLYPLLFGLSWYVLPAMLGVIGTNTLITAAVCHIHE